MRYYLFLCSWLCVPFWQRHSVILWPTLHPLCTCSATENIQFSQRDHTTGVVYLGVGCCQAVVLIHFCCFLGSPPTLPINPLLALRRIPRVFSSYKPACIPHAVVSKCKTLLLLLRRGRPILIPTLCPATAARATYLGGFQLGDFKTCCILWHLQPTFETIYLCCMWSQYFLCLKRALHSTLRPTT